jgi:hypothetical protein
MKKILLTGLFFISCSPLFSQLEYGIVGGANFQASGDLKSSVIDVGNFKETAQRRTGYYVGLYGQINIFIFYLRPELHLTHLSSKFDTISFQSTNLEIPISIGYKLLPPLSVFAGPNIQYRLDENININPSSLGDNSTLGLHLGSRLHLGSFAIDLRYERGLKESEVALLNAQGVTQTFDARGQKWSLGISYALD